MGEFVMNSQFPRVISLLRKEKKLSQKQVAADLGISQALLSHYEKGIRECGPQIALASDLTKTRPLNFHPSRETWQFCESE